MIAQDKIEYIKNHLDMPNNKLAEFLQIDRKTVRKYQNAKILIDKVETNSTNRSENVAAMKYYKELI